MRKSKRLQYHLLIEILKRKSVNSVYLVISAVKLNLTKKSDICKKKFICTLLKEKLKEIGEKKLFNYQESLKNLSHWKTESSQKNEWTQ